MARNYTSLTHQRIYAKDATSCLWEGIVHNIQPYTIFMGRKSKRVYLTIFLYLNMNIIAIYIFSVSVVPHCLWPLHKFFPSIVRKGFMNSYMYSKVEPLERAPTPLFGQLVRCSALEHSFIRLWYSHIRRFSITIVSMGYLKHLCWNRPL